MSEELVKTSPLPVSMEDMAADAQDGLGNVSVQDIAIPFLHILQSGSQSVKQGPNKIPGASEGDIINSVTQEVFNGMDGIRVVPCNYIKKYVEWIDQDEGGGLVRVHDTEDILGQCKRNTKNKDILPNGHIIVTTAYHYVLLLDAQGNFQRAVMSFTSTQLKKSRKWLSQITSIQFTDKDGKKFTPAMYSHSYRLSTTVETKDTYSWMNWVVSEPEMVNDPGLYAAAKKYKQDIDASAVRLSEPPKDGAPADDNLM